MRFEIFLINNRLLFEKDGVSSERSEIDKKSMSIYF